MTFNISNENILFVDKNRKKYLSPGERTGGGLPEIDQHHQVHEDNADYWHGEGGYEEAHMEPS